MNPKHQIDIQVEAGSVDTKALRKAALVTLAQQKIVEPCEVVIVISDDVALKALNHRFRGIDRPTDVLSFSDDTRGPFASIAGNYPHYLGDVVISIERAGVQANAVGATLVHELQLLIVHGVLHLLGHRDKRAEERKRMWAHQEALVGKLCFKIK